MSDNEENSEKSPSTAFGAIGLVVHNPLAADANESKQPEPEPNEILANIIKDAGQVANQQNDDYNDEDIQRQMNDLIHDLQSESITPDNQNLHPRKSITSAHLLDHDETSSTPAIIDSSSNNPPQGPVRSMSESRLVDAAEHPSTLPIQQDESSTEENIDDDSQQPFNTEKQNGFAEATRSGNTSRIQSASQKRAPSALSNDKLAQSADETDREVANISRRPSRSKSPLNRPRSPTPEDSRKTPTNVESKETEFFSSNNQNEDQNQTFEPPTAIVSPASRRESDNLTDQQQQQISRPSSAIKAQLNDSSSESSTDQLNHDSLSTNEQSKLIKLGEQLQIPTNDIDNRRLNSPPPSPSATKQMVLINPLLETNLPKTDQENSRPGSQTDRKSPVSSSGSTEKVIDGDIVSAKSRPVSNTSQQRETIIQQKPNSTSSRKGSSIEENDQKNKKDSRRPSINAGLPVRTSAKQKEERIPSSDKRQSPLQNRSAQQSRKNSSKSIDQTVVTPIKINSAKSQQKNEKRSSITDSENDQINTPKLPNVHLSSSQSTTPTNDKPTNAWTKQASIPPLQTTDDETTSSRPQSPKVEQIIERNQLSSTTKKPTINEQKKKDQNQSIHRSNSTDSLNQIPIVDDQSLDSTSGNLTESDRPKQRRVKSKKKDVETNTDSHNGNPQQQQQETTSQKSSKASKSMTDHSPSIRRRIATRQEKSTTPDTEPDSNTKTVRRSVKKSKTPTEDKDPVAINTTVSAKNHDNDENSQKTKSKEQALISSIGHERNTQSDTEQIVNQKQKKRRRPKRISRTTQTYESVFRRMEREQHDELRPINDTDKNIQTRRSCLRPRTRSPKRHYPVYLSTDAFKIEGISSKQLSQSQRNTSKTSVAVRSNSPQNGKLLILRPTLPFHHSDAVNVQRISLQYAIDLVPNEHKPHDAGPGHRNKTNALKHSEQTSSLPMIHSSSSLGTNNPSTKTNTKEKTVSNKTEDRTHQRKNGGAV